MKTAIKERPLEIAKIQLTDGMERIRFRIASITPCLMNSGTQVNPLHPLKSSIKQITSKGKKKTDDDHKLLSDLEFQAAIYLDEELGPYWPAENVEAMLKQAAKVNKLGKAFERSVTVEPFRCPLVYDGPRDMAGLLKRPEFRDVRNVRLGGKSVMRTRPRFSKWELEFDVLHGAEVAQEQVLAAVQYAGQYVGLSDYRPKYGKFKVLSAHYIEE